MPTPELMTWVAAQKRWTKMYAGKRYYVSARKLGCAETKDASVQAANAWWRDKQAEIDYANKARIAAQHRHPLPMDDLAAAGLGVDTDALGNVRQLLEQALLREEDERRAGKPLVPVSPVVGPAGDIVIDPPGVEDAETIRRREIMGLLEKILFGEDARLSGTVSERLSPGRIAQVETAAAILRQDSREASSGDVISDLAEDWLRGQKARVTIKDISATRYKNLRNLLHIFTEFVGPQSQVRVIDALQLEGFYHYCVARMADKINGTDGGWSSWHAKRVFSTGQRFIRWLWGRGLLELPKNIESRDFRFRIATVAIATWRTEEIHRVVNASTGKLKLALMLYCNCGMTQQDVSDLADKEVDWKRGIITRRRSKSKHNENAPVVAYPLWPLTFSLLKHHKSGESRVLLTETGRALVRRELVGDKVRENDTLSGKFRKLCKRIGFHKPMKQLRKTSATLLESHEVYGRLTSLFLGHSPRSIKDRHYAAPPQALFDDAVMWLGRQLGFVDS